jgi:hypothetical protein
MKVLFTIWILFSLSVFSQSDCDNYEAIINKVDENYAEHSQRPFLNYIKHTLSKKDTFKISLYNVNGELVYKKNLGLLEVGTYIVKFFNPKCSGVYFVSSEIGNQPAYKKAIQITSEAFPSKEAEINTDSSNIIIDGIWKRSYSEKFIPALQPDSDFHKIEYHYRYNLQVQFAKGTYKIISERIDEINSGKKINAFEGRFEVKGDTLKLFEDFKLKKVYQYKIKEDTLSISYFTSKDKKTGAMVIPMERKIYSKELNLIGMYHK